MISGISIWQLLIVLAIVVVLFGTRKLRNMGSDLGGAIRGFKQAVREGEEEDGKDKDGKLESRSDDGTTIDQESSPQQDTPREASGEAPTQDAPTREKDRS